MSIRDEPRSPQIPPFSLGTLRRSAWRHWVQRKKGDHYENSIFSPIDNYPCAGLECL